jgi:hypothetical protein
MVTDSIFLSVKDYLGPSDEDTHFDGQIIEQINSVFQTLHQLGIGPKEGFYIEDDSTTWSEYLTNGVLLHSIKSYMQMKVKMALDPPTSSFVLESMKEQVREFEWRNYTEAEFPSVKKD